MNHLCWGDTKTRLPPPNAVPLIYRRSGLAWLRRCRADKRETFKRSSLFRLFRPPSWSSVHPLTRSINHAGVGLFTRQGGVAVWSGAIWSRQLPAATNLALPNFYLNSVAVWSPIQDFFEKTSLVVVAVPGKLGPKLGNRHFQLLR